MLGGKKYLRSCRPRRRSNSVLRDGRRATLQHVPAHAAARTGQQSGSVASRTATAAHARAAAGSVPTLAPSLQTARRPSCGSPPASDTRPSRGETAATAGGGRPVAPASDRNTSTPVTGQPANAPGLSWRRCTVRSAPMLLHGAS
eukprot:364209-Chlamydomonas_euryale.AAC.7